MSGSGSRILSLTFRRGTRLPVVGYAMRIHVADAVNRSDWNLNIFEHLSV